MGSHCLQSGCRVPRGRADRNIVMTCHPNPPGGRVPRGRADRNVCEAGASDGVRMSRPARARGSKRSSHPHQNLTTKGRVPRGRADRNIRMPTHLRYHRMSRPARARGSKRQRKRAWSHDAESRPARARGSKLCRSAHRTGAGRRVPRGRADRNQDMLRRIKELEGRVPRGRADRNMRARRWRM